MIRRLGGLSLLILFLNGCGNSAVVTSTSSENEITSIESVMENFIRNEMAGDTPEDRDNQIILMCSQTKDAMQTETDLLTSVLGEYVDEFKALDFNSLSFDRKYAIWTDACRKVISERPELKVRFDQDSAANSEKFKKLQKQLDVLDKKALKLGDGTYSEMLNAQNSLEYMIQQGAQYSLTGQSREVENASCSPTTYSRWAKGEPGGTWYCYLYFLDGNEPYTIKVSGSEWGGKADQGASAGNFIEFKVSDELQEWLNRS
jgi:hypothetical protein